jgi:hypothetical protein
MWNTLYTSPINVTELRKIKLSTLGTHKPKYSYHICSLSIELLKQLLGREHEDMAAIKI